MSPFYKSVGGKEKEPLPIGDHELLEKPPVTIQVPSDKEARLIVSELIIPLKTDGEQVTVYCALSKEEKLARVHSKVEAELRKLQDALWFPTTFALLARAEEMRPDKEKPRYHYVFLRSAMYLKAIASGFSETLKALPSMFDIGWWTQTRKQLVQKALDDFL